MKRHCIRLLGTVLLLIIVSGCRWSGGIADDASRKEKKVLASYSTPLLDREPNRMHNIQITVQKLDGHEIGTGKIFSFNQTVGEPTETAGYKLATVLADDGSKTRELGGGMCQVSSTLYNVALEANLEILERHPHAKQVKYVPEGRDATTYTDLDLKFRNNTGKTLFIKGKIEKDRVQLWLLTTAVGEKNIRSPFSA